MNIIDDAPEGWSKTEDLARYLCVKAGYNPEDEACIHPQPYLVYTPIGTFHMAMETRPLWTFWVSTAEAALEHETKAAP